MTFSLLISVGSDVNELAPTGRADQSMLTDFVWIFCNEIFIVLLMYTLMHILRYMLVVFFFFFAGFMFQAHSTLTCLQLHCHYFECIPEYSGVLRLSALVTTRWTG